MENCLVKPVLVLSLTVFVLSLNNCWVNGIPQVPCYFIFGDSLSDNGNNNGLSTLAKVNYSPYGVDFPDGPTGRFSNGKNLVDFIAESLGFRIPIPPFATTPSHLPGILRGVSYASGGAGILDNTGKNLGDVISLNQQLQNHETIISDLTSFLGGVVTLAYLNKCIYSVAIGSNDYINNYYLPSSRKPTPKQFTATLTKQFSDQLTSLYHNGARKVAVFGVGIVGCTPYAISTFGRSNGSACVDHINAAIQIFNGRVKSLVDQLNRNLPDAKFTFLDSFEIASSGGPPPPDVVTDAPCCNVAKGQIQCVPNSNPCSNREQYIFWDGVHPTELTYSGLANRAYQARSPADSHPYDISHLALL